MGVTNRLVRTGAGAGLALLLGACPYESPEPLTPLASSALDARLSGAWRCLSSSEDETLRVTFTAFDAQQYVVGASEPGKDPLLMRAYAGKLRDAHVLSVQELGPSKDGTAHEWNWMRYAVVDGDLLRLRFVTDKPLESAKTPAEARALVEKQLDNSDFFEEGFVCVRVEETGK